MEVIKIEDFYPIQSVSYETETLYDIGQVHPAGIIVSAETEADWEILWTIFQQYKRPEWRDEHEKAPIRDDWHGITDHAISFQLIFRANWEVEAIKLGWCSLDWYRHERSFKAYTFFTFSELFTPEISLDSFDEMLCDMEV